MVLYPDHMFMDRLPACIVFRIEHATNMLQSSNVIHSRGVIGKSALAYTSIICTSFNIPLEQRFSQEHYSTVAV